MTETEKRMHRVCFTGHRPEKLTRHEKSIKKDLEKEIRQAVADGLNAKRLYGGHSSVTVELAFVKGYMKTLANRDFCKKKLDTRFDTHCIKTGVQLWC